MGIKSILESGVRALAPKPVEDALFGNTQAPPIPTDPDSARRLIDNIIGRQPEDAHTLQVIKNAGLTSTALTAIESAALTNLPYDPVTQTRLATNNLRLPAEPYMVADQWLGQWLQADPRRQLLYMREVDPLNPNFLPYVVEANMSHHKGLVERFVNGVTDIAGRPIGGALELFAKPAQEIETWYGTHFVWNDIADASLRHAMAKYTYEAKLNVKDWDMTWEAEARQKALEIERTGLTGGAAAQAFDDWIKTPDGHPKISAYFADMFGQVLFDPLWFAPVGHVGTVAGKTSKALLGTEDVSKLSRLATAAGRSFAGEHTVKELMLLPEINYVERKLAPSTARGSLLFLTERNPDRLADAALNKSAALLSGPLYNAADAKARLRVLALFDDTMRTGAVSDEAAQLFGKDLLEDPVLAEMHVHLRTAGTSLTDAAGKQTVKDKKAHSLLSGLIEGIAKNPEYIQTPPEEQSFLLLNHVLGNVRAVVRDGQTALYPKWFTKRYLPLVAAQKLVMGTTTLSRPGFVLLNMANNFFTYMWHATGHPMEGAEIFARSLKSELGTISRDGGHLPDYFRNLARAADIDPIAVERTVVGNVSHQDVLGQKLGYPFRLDDETVDVADAISKAHTAVSQPLKDLNPRRLRDIIALPVTAAGRVDRMTRRASFYYNLKEQLYLGSAAEDLLVHGVKGARGGLLPDIKNDLLNVGVPPEDAERAARALHGKMYNYLKKGGSLGDVVALRKSYLGAVDDLLKDTKAARLDAYDMGMKYLQRQGYSPEQSLLVMSDLEEPLTRLQGVLDNADDIPFEQLRAQIDKIGNDYWTFDRIQAEMTHTDPVMRPGNDYSKNLSLTEEGIRADLKDQLMHLERYMGTKVPEWTGNAVRMKTVMSTAREYSVGRLNRLSEIRGFYIDSLAAGVPQKELSSALRQRWSEYFDYVDDVQLNLYNQVKSEIMRVDQTQLEPLDQWYKGLLNTQKHHRQIIRDAVDEATPEAWQKAGSDVQKLYRKEADRRAANFGWDPNDEAKNLGHMRPTAALTRQIDELLEFVKGRMGEEMARDLPESYVNGMRKVMQQHALEVSKRGPDLARHLVANARFKTDFVMLNYNNQYGIDNVFQSVFPYEFFPTRTAANWMIRAWRQPGKGAMLAKALLLPHQYAKDYGMPDRLAWRIPVPLPGLDNFLENIPVIGGRVKSADFGPVYWIDPLAILFPMSNFRDDFIDEKKRSTPAGIVLDWTEQNTPLSMSPFAKIVGGITGALDRDAWTNSLFSGGPFGVPLSVDANLAMQWIQTGAPNDLSDDEKQNYSDKGYFSNNFLSRVIGLGSDRYDQYRTERAMASLVASKDIESEDAWDALRTRQGPAWEKAVAAADSEKFLSDFTGWLGFRVTGSQRGEMIRLGEQGLYQHAAARGQLEEFYNQYPEFELQQVATKGLSDPQARQEMMDNHFYFRDLEALVNKPYQLALDKIQIEIDAIDRLPVIRETDAEQRKYLIDEIQAIHEEQKVMRDALDTAYPNRNKDASLNIPPRERALQQMSRGYHELVPDAAETPEDFAARQSRYLDQFPAKTSADSEQDWQAIFIAYQTTQARYNLQISKAYDDGKFEEAEKLKAAKERDLRTIHGISESRITRYDAELYLAGQQRILTPSEQEWEQANSLFDLWMSYVSDSSPLTSRQKAAVSAYFRQDPLLRKHYNVQTIDIRTLNGDQLLSLARRREIKNHYNSLTTNAAKIDYMKAVQDEYNAINAMLGLPPIEILDYRPPPPDISYRDINDAALDFMDLNNLLDDPRDPNEAPPGFYDDPTTRKLARADTGLQIQDVTRYVDPTVQRGF